MHLENRLAFAAFSLVLLFTTPGAGWADSYHAQFIASRNAANNGQFRIAVMEANITPLDGIVGLFRDHDDVGLLNGWATFVHDPHAFNAAGAELPLTYLGKGRFRVEGWASGAVKVKYRMLLQHDRFPNDPGEDELAYARSYGVMWTGRAIFFEGAPSQNIDLVFDVPADWKITTPWQSVDSAGRHFTVENTDVLLESAFMAGTHEQEVVKFKSGEARLALSPLLSAEKAGILTALQKSLTMYERVFSSPMSGRLLVIAADGSFSGGGVMGESISILLGPSRDSSSGQAQYIISHEAFHQWTKSWKTLPDDGRMEWLIEGSAEYYSYLARVRAGLITEDAFVAELGRRAGNYLTALRTVGIAAGGATKLTGGMASYNVTYSGGMMIDFALDAMMRQSSKGKRSLDDSMKQLRSRFASGPASDEEIFKVFQKDSRVPSDFFVKYVSGREPLPLGKILSLYGLESVVTEGKDRVDVKVSKSLTATKAQRQAFARLIAQ